MRQLVRLSRRFGISFSARRMFKIYGRLIILIAAILGVVILWIYIRDLQTKAQKGENYKSAYTALSKEAITWKGKDSLYHSKAESVVTSDPAVLEELKSLRSEISGLKSNLKNLTSYNQAGTETTIHKTFVLKDSVFTYTSKYDTIRGRLKGDKLTLDEKIEVPLTITGYWTRHWFLGKKTNYVEIISLNTDSKITYNKSIIIQKKRGLFHF